MKCPRHAAKAFTLLEVIMALAILGIAMATLGQAVDRAHGNARRAADASDLTQIARSVLDEVLAGVRVFEAIDSVAITDPDDPTVAIALASVTIGASPYDGLLIVTVSVRPNDPLAGELETVRLVRWVIDPSLLDSATSPEAAI